MMHRKDKIKAIVAAVLFTIIAAAYFIDGKSTLTRYIVAVAMVLWLLTMFLLNKYKGKNEF